MLPFYIEEAKEYMENSYILWEIRGYIDGVFEAV